MPAEEKKSVLPQMCFKPEAGMSAVGNLTLTKPLCAHISPDPQMPCVFVWRGHEGTLHLPFSLKLQNKTSADAHRLFMSHLLEETAIRQKRSGGEDKQHKQGGGRANEERREEEEM